MCHYQKCSSLPVFGSAAQISGTASALGLFLFDSLSALFSKILNFSAELWLWAWKSKCGLVEWELVVCSTWGKPWVCSIKFGLISVRVKWVLCPALKDELNLRHFFPHFSLKYFELPTKALELVFGSLNPRCSVGLDLHLPGLPLREKFYSFLHWTRFYPSRRKC